jgi:hypothetical protein
VRQLLGGAAVTGQVQAQHSPVWVSSPEFVDDGLPDPAVEGQSVQEHERRTVVRKTGKVTAQAGYLHFLYFG